MNRIILFRTGATPLVFHGTKIACASSEKQDFRWINVRLYSEDRGQYVIGVAELTCWLHERGNYKAFEARTLTDALRIIKARVPELATQVEEQVKGIVSNGFKDHANLVNADWCPKISTVGV